MTPINRFASPLATALLLLSLSGLAEAATFTVSNANDSGAGTLRQAMIDAMAATGANEIVFSPTLDGTPIVLASPLPPITDSTTLTITGRGAANTIVDGANAHRPFVSAWANNRHLTLRDLTIRNGRALNENGGAIDIEGGNDSSLTIERVEFVNNTATYEGGAIRT